MRNITAIDDVIIITAVSPPFNDPYDGSLNPKHMVAAN